MASLSEMLTTTLLLITILSPATLEVDTGTGGPATWCVARSDASQAALAAAMELACRAGADCAPFQPLGACYLPNTLPSHASYAFNSYYQRQANAPGSCDFGGTATISTTDPSYGSCVYPSSPSTAGASIGSNSNATPPPGFPGTPLVPPPHRNGSGGLTPRLGPINTNASNKAACVAYSVAAVFISVSSFLALPFMYQLPV